MFGEWAVMPIPPFLLVVELCAACATLVVVVVAVEELTFIWVMGNSGSWVPNVATWTCTCEDPYP